MPNRKIDEQLHNAIRNKDRAKVELLLSQGANPFAVLTFQNHDGSSRPASVSMLQMALNSRHPKMFSLIVTRAFKARTTTFEPINISEKVFDGAGAHANTQMNLFQYAALHSDTFTLKALYQYAKDTGQTRNIQKVVNAEIKVKDDDGVQTIQFLAPMLVRTISTAQIVLNIIGVYKSAEDDLNAKALMREWLAARETSKFSSSDDDLLEIEYQGALNNLEILTQPEFGLDLELQYKEYSAKHLAQKLLEWSKDKSDWVGIKSLLRFRNVSSISEAENTADGKVFFYAMVDNGWGVKMKFKIILNFNELNSLLNPKPVAANHVALKALADKVENLESLVNESAERLYERTQASLAERPDALHCFNVLQRTIRAELTAPEMAATGRFAIRPTTKAAFVANTAQAILNVSVQSMPVPFAAVLTGITAVLVQEITQAHARTQIHGVLNATEGMNISKLATQVAALMTAKAMECYEHAITERNIKGMVSSLKAEFGKLYQFRNQAELAVHLFDQSTMSLPKPIKLSDGYHSSTSAGSTPPALSYVSSSPKSAQSWQLAAFVAHNDSDDSLPKKAKANKSVFSMIPGYSCLRPSY